jgi:hypothetical protein
LLGTAVSEGAANPPAERDDSTDRPSDGNDNAFAGGDHGLIVVPGKDLVVTRGFVQRHEKKLRELIKRAVPPLGGRVIGACWAEHSGIADDGEPPTWHGGRAATAWESGRKPGPRTRLLGRRLHVWEILIRPKIKGGSERTGPGFYPLGVVTGGAKTTTQQHANELS